MAAYHDAYVQEQYLSPPLLLLPLAVRLRPDPLRVDEAEAVQPVDLLEAHRHQLPRLMLVVAPPRPARTSHVLEAAAALVHRHARREARRDVHLVSFAFSCIVRY